MSSPDTELLHQAKLKKSNVHKLKFHSLRPFVFQA